MNINYAMIILKKFITFKKIKIYMIYKEFTVKIKKTI